MYTVSYLDYMGAYHVSRVTDSAAEAVAWCLRIGRMAWIRDARIETSKM
jgi:hypothetical protein